MTLRVLDLFSGIGGFSLGLERAGGFETVAFCEISEDRRADLATIWPGIPIYDQAILNERATTHGSFERNALISHASLLDFQFKSNAIEGIFGAIAAGIVIGIPLSFWWLFHHVSITF